jgi:hypothetical protein
MWSNFNKFLEANKNLRPVVTIKANLVKVFEGFLTVTMVKENFYHFNQIFYHVICPHFFSFGSHPANSAFPAVFTKCFLFGKQNSRGEKLIFSQFSLYFCNTILIQLNIIFVHRFL